MDERYAIGLRKLKALLPASAASEYLVYEARLHDNLRRERLFGATETTRAERAAIIDGLNQLASSHTNTSFNDLYLADAAPIVATPIAANELQVVLEFQQHETGLTIAWNAPFLGQIATPFTPPYANDVLPVVIKALDAIQYADYPYDGPQFNDGEQHMLAAHGLWQHNRVATQANTLVGQALYQALGTLGSHTLNSVRNYGIDQGRRLHYILRFARNTVQLAALPWELIADQDGAILLSNGSAIDSCERYINLERALPPAPTTTQPPHLLALLPGAHLSQQQRRAERVARLASWEKLRAAGQISFDEISPLTLPALSDYLRSAARKPTIIHYFGHGIYQDGQGYLLFDNDNGGQSMVSATRLASLLGNTRLIVLHACQSATISQLGGLLSGVAPALSLVAGAVVAMQLSMRVAAATRFSEVFYDELLQSRRSLQAAVATARQTLFFEEQDGVSWFVPTLYIRSREPQPMFV